MFADLHMHSTASDGTDGPEQLADLAIAAGLGAIALTDHDTTDGLEACRGACEARGVRFVGGIELSTDRSAPRGTLHILGYFVRAGTSALSLLIQRMRQTRLERNGLILKRLRDLGLDVTEQDVLDVAGTAPPGRPHIATVLEKKGYVHSASEAFHRYLGHGTAAYMRMDRLPAKEAIAAIHGAGGMAVLAHPSQLRYADEADLAAILKGLKHMGLDGLEVDHPDHVAAQKALYQEMGDRFGLLATGGSDYHGTRKTTAMGACGMEQGPFQSLCEARSRPEGPI